MIKFELKPLYNTCDQIPVAYEAVAEVLHNRNRGWIEDVQVPNLEGSLISACSSLPNEAEFFTEACSVTPCCNQIPAQQRGKSKFPRGILT